MGKNLRKWLQGILMTMDLATVMIVFWTGLGSPAMISIQGNTQLIIYAGATNAITKDIWCQSYETFYCILMVPTDMLECLFQPIPFRNLQLRPCSGVVPCILACIHANIGPFKYFLQVFYFF